MEEIAVIGAACSIASTDHGSEQGPSAIQQSPLVNALDINLAWDHIIFSRGKERQLEAMESVIRYSTHIAKRTAKAVVREERFLTIGGDHSCAIGTWSGAAHQLRAKGDMGLLWIDAHIDAHTPCTSDTGNIHGMPVAHLLGQGEERLRHLLDNQDKLKPENIALIGIRSFEPPEQELVERLGVRVYYIEEVLERGIDVVLNEAYQRVNQNTAAYGISIDIDGFDPEFAPAVHTTVPGGINPQEFIKALAKMPKDKLIGAEIAEFNPALDKDQITEKLIAELIDTLFGAPLTKKSMTADTVAKECCLL
ncbi:MAG: arginase [Coxiellaceae bacterium]|nr:arginase [Coxiellaceae bacterium]